MRLATWNVNSIRMRLPLVQRFLESEKPDLLFLQEIKCLESVFPSLDCGALGYHSSVVGQKSYNGVAILSTAPFTVLCRALPGLPEDDAQARYLEIEQDGIVYGNLYLPNGNSGGEAGFTYKLAWMEALRRRAAFCLRADKELVLAGDFNVCPEDRDLANGALPEGDALRHPESRARFRSLLWEGMTDAVRALHPDETLYTFWDYTGGAWPSNRGLRIDHILLSAVLAERLTGVAIHREERDRESPSDHVPVMATMA
jgi:exodeoxyribonuclease-3